MDFLPIEFVFFFALLHIFVMCVKNHRFGTHSNKQIRFEAVNIRIFVWHFLGITFKIKPNSE